MKGLTLWLTGAGGPLMANLARKVEGILLERGVPVELLGADEAREALRAGLGDSAEERAAYVRRVGLVCRLLARNGVVAIATEPAAPELLRDEAQRSPGRFAEVEVRRADAAAESPAAAPTSGAAAGAEAPAVVVAVREGEEEAGAMAIVSLLEERGHVPSAAAGGYSTAEEEAVKARLRDLGYI